MFLDSLENPVTTFAPFYISRSPPHDENTLDSLTPPKKKISKNAQEKREQLLTSGLRKHLSMDYNNPVFPNLSSVPVLSFQPIEGFLFCFGGSSVSKRVKAPKASIPGRLHERCSGWWSSEP